MAKRLVAEAKDMKGSVVLCFQPAEELGGAKGGAEAMIKDGALEWAKADARSACTSGRTCRSAWSASPPGRGWRRWTSSR
jgi:metal-dependent amidase/aminoacylase/carboxypeptidase family protein